MFARMLSCLLGAMCLMILISSGCGSGGPPLGEVTGTVTLDGKPLVGASVQFDPGNTRPASGVTDNQGNYKLSFIPGTEGAPVGNNIVRIYPKSSNETGDDLPESEIVSIPAKYNEESELTAEVTTGANKFDFALESE